MPDHVIGEDGTISPETRQAFGLPEKVTNIKELESGRSAAEKSLGEKNAELDRTRRELEEAQRDLDDLQGLLGNDDDKPG